LIAELSEPWWIAEDVGFAGEGFAELTG